MRDELIVAKVDIDKEPGTMEKYGVHGIPTLILLREGRAASVKVGTTTQSHLVSWPQSFLPPLGSRVSSMATEPRRETLQLSLLARDGGT